MILAVWLGKSDPVVECLTCVNGFVMCVCVCVLCFCCLLGLALCLFWPQGPPLPLHQQLCRLAQTGDRRRECASAPPRACFLASAGIGAAGSAAWDAFHLAKDCCFSPRALLQFECLHCKMPIWAVWVARVRAAAVILTKLAPLSQAGMCEIQVESLDRGSKACCRRSKTNSDGSDPLTGLWFSGRWVNATTSSSLASPAACQHVDAFYSFHGFVARPFPPFP